MFDRRNWSYLSEAFSVITSRPETENLIKYGLRNTYYYLLKNCAGILQGDLRIKEGKEEQGSEVKFRLFPKNFKTPPKLRFWRREIPY